MNRHTRLEPVMSCTSLLKSDDIVNSNIQARKALHTLVDNARTVEMGEIGHELPPLTPR